MVNHLKSTISGHSSSNQSSNIHHHSAKKPDPPSRALESGQPQYQVVSPTRSSREKSIPSSFFARHQTKPTTKLSTAGAMEAPQNHRLAGTDEAKRGPTSTPPYSNSRGPARKASLGDGGEQGDEHRARRGAPAGPSVESKSRDRRKEIKALQLPAKVRKRVDLIANPGASAAAKRKQIMKARLQRLREMQHVMTSEQAITESLCGALKQQIAETRAALTFTERRTVFVTTEMQRMARRLEQSRAQAVAEEERVAANLSQRRRHNTRRLMRDRETTARHHVLQKLRDMMQDMTKRQRRDRDLHADWCRRFWKRCEPWLVKVLAWFFEGALVLLSIGISIISALVFVLRIASYCAQFALRCSRPKGDPPWRRQSKTGGAFSNSALQFQAFNDSLRESSQPYGGSERE
jgi:hypothetical protein